MPARTRKTEAALIGKPWQAETVDEVLAILAGEFTPISDVRGSALYRQQLLKTLLRKFFAAEEVAPNDNKIARFLPKRDDSIPHESGHKHVTGEAIYVDDVAQTETMLEVWPSVRPMPTRKFCGGTRRRRAPCRGSARFCWRRTCRV